MKVSIIIKALNEEKDIERAIVSALEASKKLDAEVILADSLSEDRTVEIAQKHPIRIVQITDKKDRSCGMGAQLGYMYAKGDYIYILDADMELEKGFLEKAIEVMTKEPDIAGVGGTIKEMTESNTVFKRRKDSQKNLRDSYEKALMMGGLYRRQAIKKVGYFSNPNLHAYEESDLGNRLAVAGYRLKRIAVPMVRHYGDDTTSLQIFMNRWRSRYLWGCGEYLRYNIFKPTFGRVVWELKIYLAVIAIWTMLIISAILTPFSSIPLILTTIVIIAGLLLLLARKRSIYQAGFSLFSWNMTAMGLVCGFLSATKKINRKIPTRVVK